MSAIAGIWWWDGRPVSDSLIAAFDAHSQPAGPDGGETVNPLPGLALQSHMLRFDSLSARERQPYAFGAGSVVCWDGRLDNRSDLLLNLHRDLGPEDSDACLVAAAYTRWGEDCFARLVGDWSLALWDGSRRILLLARDYFGNRPLYYRHMPEGLAWATRIDALTAAFGLCSEPSDEYITGRLTTGVPPDVTPYKTIRAVRAGHRLLATAQRDVIPRRYWVFEPSTVRFNDPRAYDDQLRALLSEAVGVRLRANRPVWSHLSGGFDSSSIVCLAHALIARRQVEAPAVRTASIVYSTDPEADEGQYIGAVERQCGLETVRVDFTGQPSFKDLLGRRHPLSSPLAWEKLEGFMRAAEDRIILSGELGDTFMMQSVYARLGLLEPLYEGDLRRLVHLCWDRAKQKQIPVFRLFWRLAREAADTRNFGAWERSESNGVLSSQLPKAVRVRPPTRTPSDIPCVDGFPRLKRVLARAIYSFADSALYTSYDDNPTVWRSFPFTHRPLVQYVLAVPYLSLWHPNQYRAGMKRALKNVLPEEFLARRFKSKVAPAFARDRRERMTDLSRFGAPEGKVEDWELVRRGYLDPKMLGEAVRSLQLGAKSPESNFHDRWFHLEAWLRTLATFQDQERGQSRQYQPVNKLNLDVRLDAGVLSEKCSANLRF